MFLTLFSVLHIVYIKFFTSPFTILVLFLKIVENNLERTLLGAAAKSYQSEEELMIYIIILYLYYYILYPPHHQQSYRHR